MEINLTKYMSVYISESLCLADGLTSCVQGTNFLPGEGIHSENLAGVVKGFH